MSPDFHKDMEIGMSPDFHNGIEIGMRATAKAAHSEHATHAGEADALTAEGHYDYTGSKLGMWIFLLTEMLLFGGLFLVYSVYRFTHPRDFHNAAQDLNLVLGTINTLVLLTSSLTMALSITALQKGQRKLSLLFLVTTILLGVVFLINKYFEWTAKIHHGIYPNSPQLLNFPQGEILFFGLYYVMTGLHGLHVLVGIVLLSIMVSVVRKKPCEVRAFDPVMLKQVWGARLALQNEAGAELWQSDRIGDGVDSVRVTVNYHPSEERMQPRDYVVLENCGLYWHLVDIIWIFLFPLFYLIT